MSPARAPGHLNSVRILAISGSLRAQSSNTALLGALSLLAPPGREIVLYEELDRIPPFNPDTEASGDSGPVSRFRTAIRESAVVLFSTPEYAHGLPGSLKNALDWVVGTGELSEKPAVLVNSSARGVYAQAALREVLKAMNARLMLDAEVTVDLPGRGWTPARIAAEPAYAAALRAFLESLA